MSDDLKKIPAERFDFDDHKKNKEENDQGKILNDVRVHTMPDKFLRHLSLIKVKGGGRGILPNKKKKVNKNLLIVLVVAVFFILILALAAWLFVRSINQTKDEKEQAVVAVDEELLVIEKEVEQEQEESNKDKESVNCSADNCQACAVEQCLLFADSCYLGLVSAPCEDNSLEECVVRKCMTAEEVGQRLEDDDDSQLENEILNEPRTMVDTDGDGLSDIEESVWQTDYLQADSDSDGYLDGQEVFNLYNPLASDSEQLVDGLLVKVFNNIKENYSFFYPSAFDLRIIDEQQKNVSLLSTSTQEFFNVLVLENENGFQDINEWFIFNNPGLLITELDGQVTEIRVGGRPAILTKDKLNAYVLVGDRIFLISYNAGLLEEMNFLTTFGMLLNSFEFMVDVF